MMSSREWRVQIGSASPLPAAEWLALLDDPSQVFLCRGEALPLNEETRQRYLNCVQSWRERFGDGPLSLIHSPGRINLRGMHVDTHGGWLNLMTHQRGVVLAIGAQDSHRIDVYNQDAQHQPFLSDWHSIPDEAAGWAAYLIGGLRAFRELNPHDMVTGIRAVASGNVPQGASLSSSAALCLAWLTGLGALSKRDWDAEQLILAARRAEWLAGARTGTGDQAAIVLGRADAVVHTTLLAEDFTLDKTEWLPFPKRWRLLVIESGTTRQLSGAARVAYARNRFAYSAALELFRRAMTQSGVAASHVAACDRLSAIDPGKLGGPQGIWTMLQRVPEKADLTMLREMALPGLDDAYDSLFGDVPQQERPETFPIRAPLLYALAESARAAQFPHWLRTDNIAEAGRSMSIGHDGDRVRTATGEVWQPDYSDLTLQELAESKSPLESVSGYYGASSPAMDRLCDVAMEAGAAGACLTGAGIAGVVLALCQEHTLCAVRDKVVKCLQSKAYAECAVLQTPLSPTQAEAMVIEQRVVPGVGAIIPR